MTEPATTDTPAEKEERKPVPAPEASKDDEARSPVPTPEANHTNALMPEAVFTPGVGSNIIVLESVREQAEQRLTNYLAPKLIEDLKARGQDESMIAALFDKSYVSLFGELNHGRTDVKIRISGPNIGSNEALVGELLVQALQAHPIFQGLFSAEKPPHAQVHREQGHAQLEVHIPQMETAAYAQLVQGLAADVTLLPKAAPAAEVAVNDNAAPIPETAVVPAETEATPDPKATPATTVDSVNPVGKAVAQERQVG